MRTLLVLLFAATLFACGTATPDTAPPPAGEASDAGRPADAAGPPDAAAPPDAGGTDGGSATDAGSNEDAGSSTTFTAVYALFEVRCTGCHSGSTDLDLGTRAAAYSNLVGKQPSPGEMCGRTPHTRVIPGDAEHSLLFQKLAGTADCGLRMPQGPEVGPSRPKPFTTAELAVVHDWIAAGAHDD